MHLSEIENKKLSETGLQEKMPKYDRELYQDLIVRVIIEVKHLS